MSDKSSTTKRPDDGDTKLDRDEYKIMLNDDCCFLLYFITGVYFGPDLKEERPPKSILQRKNEGLPSYTSEQLAGTSMRSTEIEQIYQFLLRKTNGFVIELSTLRRFIEGHLLSNCQNETYHYPQFSDLFPLDLHPQIELDDHSRMIANIVFTGSPEISHLKPEEVERFKRLTGLEDFLLTRNAARLQNLVYSGELHTVTVEEPIKKYFRKCLKKRHLEDILEPPSKGTLCSDTPKRHRLALPLSPRVEVGVEVTDEPAIVVLPSQPSREELDAIIGAARNGYALTGSAAKGLVGPVIGSMNIGQSQDSYLFRVALPGVQRGSGALQCDIESNGKVLIRGTSTTGEKKVERYSQTFEMQTHNMCPQGPFSILFHLPGPVDPRQFSGHFGCDAILEGTVMKLKPPRPAS